MAFKYVKHGVKRKHGIIADVLPTLEEIAGIDGVKKVVPGRISYSPRRGIKEAKIKYQREIISGFKLLARSRGSVQEIFVVVENSKRDDVRQTLKGLG
jgi:hypothetical protein